MPIWYGFTTQQTSAMNELLGQREMLQELIFSVFLGGSFAVVFLLLNNDLQSIQSDSGLKRFQSRCPIRYIFLEKYNQSVIESKNLTCQVKCFTIKYEHQLLMI